MVFKCRLHGPSDSSILGGSRVGVLVHIGNASEMDWIGHYLMIKRRSRRGDRDGEGKVHCVQTTCAKCATVGPLACQAGH